MKLIVELIKFLKYLLISSLLIIISCYPLKERVGDNEMSNDNLINNTMTRQDSIYKLAKDLNIIYNPSNESINDVLKKIIDSKISLIARLDSLNKRAEIMESAVIHYKKKENKLTKNKLLSEIDKIKSELDKIKTLSNPKIEIHKRDKTAIPEVKIPNTVPTLKSLPSGNYITRIDKYYTISIFITTNGKIVMGKPKLDSTTVIKGDKNFSGRLKKELNQIRNRLNN